MQRPSHRPSARQTGGGACRRAWGTCLGMGSGRGASTAVLPCHAWPGQGSDQGPPLPRSSLCSFSCIFMPGCREKDGNVLETTNAVIAHALKQRTKDDVTGGWPASVAAAACRTCARRQQLRCWPRQGDEMGKQARVQYLRPALLTCSPPLAPGMLGVQRWWCACGRLASGSCAPPPRTLTMARRRRL